MEFRKRKVLGYGLLACVWILLAGWQLHEHSRVRESAQAALRSRSFDIAETLSAFIRGLRFRGTILQERLEPILNEMVTQRTNELSLSSELLSVVLLNAQNEPVAAAGRPLDLLQSDIMQRGERWGRETLTIINPVDLGGILTEGVTNPTVVLPPMTNSPSPEGRRGEPDDSRRTSPPSENHAEPQTSNGTNVAAPPPPGESRRGPPRSGGSRRPPWLRSMNDADYQSLLKKRALHGLALVLSTNSMTETVRQDFWMRMFIMALATLSVSGLALAWRNIAKTSELQIRLVRASEMNTHLKQMNLAAAGLAHETRNPLNIIRGLAHLISKEPADSPEIRQRTESIINEVDKVAAQLNEFINYSRPREVRRVTVPLKSVFIEVTRALEYDIDEKQIKISAADEGVSVAADEQLLRQSLFNLLLNAIQAVPNGGSIELNAAKSGNEAMIEVRDNGPGVEPDKRAEIFKPYFTTQKSGTGLGLAVCRQIVLAHGWDIQCLPNDPQGAVFRISHIEIAGN